MKVAIYTRVSGKSNRQDATNQSHQLIEYCQRQGWDYVEYTDRMTGTKADRIDFQRLFEDARLRRFDLVLFWALDRFSREGTLKTLEYLQRLDTYSVGWKSYTEQYLDSTGMFRDAIWSKDSTDGFSMSSTICN
jgi:DNA invertase Pin-like site-specific DNA recombinase